MRIHTLYIPSVEPKSCYYIIQLQCNTATPSLSGRPHTVLALFPGTIDGFWWDPGSWKSGGRQDWLLLKCNPFTFSFLKVRMQDGIKCLERNHVQEIHYYKGTHENPCTEAREPTTWPVYHHFFLGGEKLSTYPWNGDAPVLSTVTWKVVVKWDMLPQNQNRGMKKLNTQNGSTCIKMNTLTRTSIRHPKSPKNPHQYRCKDIITVQRQNDPSPQQTLHGVPACLSFSGRTEHLSYTQLDQRTGALRAEGMILYWIKWSCHPPRSVIMILGKLSKLVNDNKFSYSLMTPNHLSASSYKAPRRCRSCSSITAWFVIRGKRQEELREEIE